MHHDVCSLRYHPCVLLSGHFFIGGHKTKDEWDDIADLKPQEKETAREWEEKFRSKYIVR